MDYRPDISTTVELYRHPINWLTVGTILFLGSLWTIGLLIAKPGHAQASTPYLSVFGNDIFAGGAFDPNCGAMTDGKIDTSSIGAPDRGSGSQLAAFALDTINGFNTAELRSGTPALPPNGLRFANTAGPDGRFDGSHCITDYTFPATPPPGAITIDPSIEWIAFDIAFMYSGTYYGKPTSNVPPSAGARRLYSDSVYPIDDGTHIKMYIDGDIIICGCREKGDLPGYYANHTGNIEYAGGWSKAGDIPSVTIIAKGNIYINESVTRLDGTYVAVPDPTAPAGSTGQIYTCVHYIPAPAGTNEFGTMDIYKKGDLGNAAYQTNCNKQLVVNGSLVAEHINFLRTYGDIASSVAGEHPYLGGIFPNAAEVIINGPETYIGAPIVDSYSQTYDYFTSLPPIL